MAAVSKLQLTFLNEDGGKVYFNYNYADPNVEKASVAALMSGIVTNGAIFSTPPVTAKAAKIITTQETSIDLS